MHLTLEISVDRTNGDGLPLNYDLLATALGGGVIQGSLPSGGPNALAEQEFSVRRDQDKDDGPGLRLAFAITVAHFANALMHLQRTRPLADPAGVRP